MKNSEQPIVPVTINGEYTPVQFRGLTKREYFAAMAMQGLLANSIVMQAITLDDKDGDGGTFLANESIRFADELLKRLG